MRLYHHGVNILLRSASFNITEPGLPDFAIEDFMAVQVRYPAKLPGRDDLYLGIFILK